MQTHSYVTPRIGSRPLFVWLLLLLSNSSSLLAIADLPTRTTIDLNQQVRAMIYITYRFTRLVYSPPHNHTKLSEQQERNATYTVAMVDGAMQYTAQGSTVSIVQPTEGASFTETSPVNYTGNFPTPANMLLVDEDSPLGSGNQFGSVNPHFVRGRLKDVLKYVAGCSKLATVNGSPHNPYGTYVVSTTLNVKAFTPDWQEIDLCAIVPTITIQQPPRPE